MVFFKRYLPIISFTVGVSALCFQTLVLHPWHDYLDNEFNELKKLKFDQDTRFREQDQIKLIKIQVLEEKIDRLIRRHEEKRLKREKLMSM